MMWLNAGETFAQKMYEHAASIRPKGGAPCPDGEAEERARLARLKDPELARGEYDAWLLTSEGRSDRLRADERKLIGPLTEQLALAKRANFSDPRLVEKRRHEIAMLEFRLGQIDETLKSTDKLEPTPFDRWLSWEISSAGWRIQCYESMLKEQEDWLAVKYEMSREFPLPVGVEPL